ncbi:MAG: hypothetical protein IJ815_05580 [Lachnospiraceae bacterium]|nr:hypothetical protein [Lachnospiraceae bacterium]
MGDVVFTAVVFTAVVLLLDTLLDIGLAVTMALFVGIVDITCDTEPLPDGLVESV